MDFIKMCAVLFSATGFWKLIEVIFVQRNQKRIRSAEIKNLQAQTEVSVVQNWIHWSQTLEKRVKELETVAEENKELKKQIESQRQRIVELESKVEKVQKENESLLQKMAGRTS